MTVGTGSLVGGRYRLGELLGRGGMADVFRAVDERLERAVAVKVLRDSTASSSERARFAAEARTVGLLAHPAIVALLDAGLEEDQPWIAMELVEGPTLAARFDGTPLPVDEVERIGGQLAAGLAYAHAARVVHRDVKPGNVLLAADGSARLADFGIARLLDSTTRHTAVGQAIGSPAYLSPEQATGSDVTGAADVYALGLVLLEALTGERAFRGTTAEVVHARLVAPPTVPDTLPGPWVPLLRRMTAVDPAARPSAEAVAAALAGGPDATVPFVPPTARTRVFAAGGAVRTTAAGLPRRWLLVGAAVLVLALVPWLLLRGADGPQTTPSPSTSPTVSATPTVSPSPSVTRSASTVTQPRTTAPATKAGPGKKADGKGKKGGKGKKN